MNRKFILVISALIITLALVLTACNNGNNCKHTFSDKWSCDEEYHWRAATCEHKEEYADKSRHTFIDGVCNICRYKTALDFALSDDGLSYVVTGVDVKSVGVTVTIPESYNGKNVTAVGRGAFSGCESMLAVAVPPTVVSFGENAFEKCNKLEGVYIKDISAWCRIGFTGLYSNPLYFAGKLYLNGVSVNNLVLPQDVVSIGNSAFSGCTSINKIIFPDSVKTIGSLAFRGCVNLEEAVIPSGVTSIGDGAFSGCSKLRSVELRCEIEMISNSLFAGCINLGRVILPDSVKYIGNSAFYGCSDLTELVLPRTIMEIGSRALDGCGKLDRLYFKGSLNDWQNVDVSEYADLTVYVYSDEKPVGSGNFWHYVDGAPVVW